MASFRAERARGLQDLGEGPPVETPRFELKRVASPDSPGGLPSP